MKNALLLAGALRRSMAVQATVKVAQDTSKQVFPAVSAAGHHQDIVTVVREMKERYAKADSKVALSAEDKDHCYAELLKAANQLPGPPVSEADIRGQVAFKDEYSMGELPLFKSQ